jgi:hypothetical protein
MISRKAHVARIPLKKMIPDASVRSDKVRGAGGDFDPAEAVLSVSTGGSGTAVSVLTPREGSRALRRPMTRHVAAML